MSNISVYPQGQKIKDRLVPASVPNGQMEFATYLGYIKDGKWEDVVLDVRAGRVDKLAAPGVTISGTFSRREAKGLMDHSGIIAIDIDDQDNAEMQVDELGGDAFLYALHKSIRGRGYVAYFRIDPDKHLESFLSLEKRLADKYGLIVDPSGKDVSRYRFVSHDPEAWIRSEAPPVYKTYLPKRKTEPKRVYIHSEGDISHIMDQIQSRGINLAESYHDWINLGFAIASKYGESGEQYFQIISQQSSKYNAEQCGKKYQQLCKSGRNGRTIATLFYLCKEAGIDIQTARTKHIERTAKVHRKKVGQNGGYKSDSDARSSTERILNEIDDFTGEDVTQIVAQVFDLSESELNEDKGKTELDDLKAYLRASELRFNSVTRNYEKAGEPISDRDINSIYLGALEAFGKKGVNKALIESLIDSDFVSEYDPFLEFFQRNAHEQPEGLIEQLCNCIQFRQIIQLEGVDSLMSNYVELFLTKWLMSVVASMHGTYSLMVLVLSGGQGIGKTNFFRGLMPPELAGYYGESKLDGGKDDEILMCKKAILCDDEFGGKSKQEAKKLKEISSKQFFSIRKPYGKVHEDLKRRAVLCGTSNDEEIINDPTGNRRIIPINVISIDWEAYKLIDKRLLWMEIYNLWKQVGEGWMLDADEIAILNAATTQNEQPSIEKEAILMFFEQPGPGKLDVWWPNTKIKNYIESNSRLQISSYKLGASLKAMGFVKKNIKLGGISTPCYNLVQKSNHLKGGDYEQVDF
jgi:hypothetical protein